MFNRHFSTQDQAWGARFKNCKGDWGKKFEEHLGRAPWMRQRSAANITETADQFAISLYAAGLQKEHFHLSVDGSEVLTIRYQAPAQAGQEYIYQEYDPAASFERAFQLNGKVLTDQIQASYTDGVLTVILPKDPETNKPAQEIQVL